MRVNKLANKVINDYISQINIESDFDLPSLLKRHKKYIKHVEKSMSTIRGDVVESLSKLNIDKDKEAILRLKQH